MPKTLEEFRTENPAYKDWGDEELAQGLHEKFYKDTDYNEFVTDIGSPELADFRTGHELRMAGYRTPDPEFQDMDPIGETMYDEQIGAYAEEFGVPVNLMTRQMMAESGGNPNAIGPSTKYGTAKGLMQHIDSTASDLGMDNPFDPDQSLRGGAQYMRQMYDIFGDWNYALAAYNTGPSNMDKILAGKMQYPQETLDYVKKITGIDLLTYTGVKPALERPLNQAPVTVVDTVDRTKPAEQPEEKKEEEPVDAGPKTIRRDDPMWGTLLSSDDEANYSAKRSGKMVYEGTKETARRTAKGTLMLGLDFRDRKTLAEQGRAGASRTTDFMTPVERMYVGRAWAEASEKKGSALTDTERTNIRVNTLLGMSEERNALIGKAMDSIDSKLASDPKYLETRGFWEDLLRMTPQVGGQVLATLASGGIAGTITMGLQIAGGKYESLIAQGVDPQRAMYASLADAFMQAPLEQIGISKMLKPFKAGLIKHMGEAMATEWLTEFLQAHPDAITEIWATNKGEGTGKMFEIYRENLGTILKNGAYEGLVAATLAGLGGAVKVGHTIYTTEKLSDDQTESKALLIDQINRAEGIDDDAKARVIEEIKNAEIKTMEEGVEDQKEITEAREAEESMPGTPEADLKSQQELYEKEFGDGEQETDVREPAPEQEAVVDDEPDVAERPEEPKEEPVTDKAKLKKEAAGKKLDKLTVSQVKEQPKDKLKELVAHYEKKKDHNRNDKARFRAAKEALEATKTPKPDVWEKEIEPLMRKVHEAEKTPGRKMSKEEVEMMDKDWKEYSKSRGYTEQEIADFEAFRNKVKELEKRGVPIDEIQGFDAEVSRRIKQEKVDAKLAEKDKSKKPVTEGKELKKVVVTDTKRFEDFAAKRTGELFKDKKGHLEVKYVGKQKFNILDNGKVIKEKQSVTDVLAWQASLKEKGVKDTYLDVVPSKGEAQTFGPYTSEQAHKMQADLATDKTFSGATFAIRTEKDKSKTQVPEMIRDSDYALKEFENAPGGPWENEEAQIERHDLQDSANDKGILLTVDETKETIFVQHIVVPKGKESAGAVVMRALVKESKKLGKPLEGIIINPKLKADLFKKTGVKIEPGPPEFPGDATGPTHIITIEDIKKKKKLSAADKKFLAERKAARGGQSVQEVLTEEKYRYKYKEQPGTQLSDKDADDEGARRAALTPVEGMADPREAEGMVINPDNGEWVTPEELEDASQERKYRPADNRPKHLKGTSFHRAYGNDAHDDGVGTIFSRHDQWEDTGNNPDLFTEDDLNNPDVSLIADTLEEAADIERQIAKGTWKYQFLLDKVIEGSDYVALGLADPSGPMWNVGQKGVIVRGVNRTWMKPDGTVGSTHIFLNPKAISMMYNNDRNVEGVLVHELVHALLKVRLGGSDTFEAQEFYRKVANIWQTIPEDQLDRMRELGNMYRDATPDEFMALGLRLMHKSNIYSNIFWNIERTQNDFSSKYWEEVYNYIVVEPEILADMSRIESPIGKLTKPREKKTVARRLMETTLDFLGIKIGNKKNTIADEILKLSEEYISGVRKQSLYNYNDSELGGLFTSNSLDLTPFRDRFPEGATVLNPAIKEPNGNIWYSPLGHWDIKDWEGNARIGDEGFVAIDKAGSILEYYDRVTAGRLVDPNKTVIDPDGTLVTEDMKWIAEEMESSEPYDKPKGIVEVIAQREHKAGRHISPNVSDGEFTKLGSVGAAKLATRLKELKSGKQPGVILRKKKVTKKPPLTETEMALLDARKKARGGKSLRETWADVRKEHQAKAKAMRRKVEPAVTGKKRGITKWELLRPTDNLANMTEAKLEMEHIRVMQEVTNAVKEGRSDTRSSYYMQRLVAINTLFEKAKRTQMVAQRKTEAEAEKAAGGTEKAKIRTFKKEYKRAVRLDLPNSVVQFNKGRLIDLIGPEAFYKWSGEEAPVVSQRKQKEAAAKKQEVQIFTDKQIADAKDEAGVPPSTPHKVVKIDPAKYLDLTTGTDKRKEAIVAKSPDKFDQAELDKSGAPLLVIGENGAVTGHDGRHRAATMMKSGKGEMDIILLGNVGAPEVYAQKFGQHQRATIFTPVKITKIKEYTEKDAEREGTKLKGAQSKQEARDLYDKVMNHLESEYLETGRSINKDYVSGITTAVKQAHLLGAIDDATFDEADAKIRAAYMGGAQDYEIDEFESSEPVHPTQAKFDKFSPVKVKFDAYYGREEGYTTSGYQFTIMDPNHPAYQGTFSTETLTKEAMDRKFKEIHKTWGLPQLEFKKSEDYMAEPTKHVYDSKVDEETARLAERGAKKESKWSRMKEVLKDIRNRAREFEYLKREEASDVQAKLRKLKKAKAMAARKTVDQLKDSIEGLNKTQYHNLQRLAYLMDLREQVDINEQRDAEKKDRIVTANPYGWSDAKIKKEATKVWNIVRSDPATELAWLKRQKAWLDLRKIYAKSMKDVGFEVGNRLKRAYYFRHQMLDYMSLEHEKGLEGSSNRLVVPTNRSYLRHRGAENSYKMNFNYIQAEFEVIAQMMYDTEVAQTLAEIMDRHGSKTKLEGYELYKPRENAVFYMANTIPAQVFEKAMEEGAKTLEIPRDAVKQTLALGGKYKGWYLPSGVAKTLNHALETKPKPMWYRVLIQAPIRYWKVYQLMAPMRVLKYNIRNMTGDAEAVFIGNPGVFKWAGVAMKELGAWRNKGKISKDLQDWIDFGGMESTLQAQEILTILEEPEFVKVLEEGGPQGIEKAWEAIKKPFKWAGGKIRTWTDLREMWLRFAAYKKFKAELDKNNGKPKSYAASLAAEVDQIDDNGGKAFMMSNDLLGAYDRVSLHGQGLRENLMPFWSFQEVNFTRQKTMIKNALNNDEAMAQLGRRLGAKTPIIALKLGKWFFRFMAGTIIMQIYNNAVWGDAEDSLPEDMRRRPHIILWHTKGRNPDIFYFPRVGIVGDLLEWAGVDTLPADTYDLITGKRSLKQIVDSYEYGIKNLSDLTNKLVQSLGPQYKMPIEFLMAEKVFPSVFNRQPITDKVKYLFDNFALGGMYDKVVGNPTRNNWTKRELIKLGVYYEDQKRLGWLALQQRISDYKRDAGLGKSGFITTPSGSALYNVGKAVRYGDMDALYENFVKYMRLTQKKLLTEPVDFGDTIRNQWEKLEPLDGLNETHKALLLSTFTERDWHNLKLAYEYYGEIASGQQFVEENILSPKEKK
jgi:hypothetical protein